MTRDVGNMKKELRTSSGERKVDLLNALAYAIRRQAPKEAAGFANQALALARQLKYEIGIGHGLVNKGRVTQIQGDTNAAHGYFQKALKRLTKSGDKVGIAAAQRGIGVCLSIQMEYNTALELHLKSIDLCEQVGDKEGLASSHNGIAFIHWKRGEFEETLKHLTLAMESYMESGNKARAAVITNNIGATFEHQGQLDEALKQYLKAEQLWIELNQLQNVDIALVYSNIGNIYRIKNEADLALTWYMKALEIQQTIDHREGQAITLGNLGVIYAARKDFAKADKHLDQALSIAREISDKTIETDCYKYLTDRFVAQEAYKEAYDNLKKYDDLRQKMFDEEKNKQIAEMRTRYETEKATREAEIHRLRNVELAKEIEARTEAETELRKHQDQLEELVIERTEELEAERKELKDKNVVLNHLLKHLEEQREEDRQKTYLDIDKNVRPLLGRLKRNLAPRYKKDVEAIEITFDAILTKDIDEFKKRYSKLTSRESEVCKLISQGLSSKQIADKLSLSLVTIYTFRQRIRKKLDLQNKDVDLATYLRSH